LLAAALLLIAACTSPEQSPFRSSGVQPHQGDHSKHGGSPSVRKSYEPKADDPSTTNDESNDQPVGHFGTVTLIASQEESGHTYTLDVEVEGTEAKRLYFRKGGWVHKRSGSSASSAKSRRSHSAGRYPLVPHENHLPIAVLSRRLKTRKVYAGSNSHSSFIAAIPNNGGWAGRLKPMDKGANEAS
jgi:hypothetical protein